MAVANNDPDAWFDEYIKTMSSDEEEVEEDMSEEFEAKELASYYREVADSDGFEVGDHPQLFDEIFGLICRHYCPPDKTVHPTQYNRLTALAQMAIHHHNNNKNTSYGNVKVLMANTEPTRGLFYITFKATSMLDESTETFQAKVYVDIPPAIEEVEFVRIKPTN